MADGPDVQPDEGDSVYIEGHGPAVVESVTQAAGQRRYKVRYPDDTHYTVSREQILAREPSRKFNRGDSDGARTPGRSTSAPRRLEYLGRAFDDVNRNVTSKTATFALIASMVGGGVLSLPYAMTQCGLVLGTIALLVSGVASAWTLDMLVDCARSTGRDTFDLIGHAAFGEVSRKLTSILLFLLCWLALVGYSVLVGDLLVPLLELIAPQLEDVPHETLRRGTLIGAMLLLSPMCFKDGLHSLRFLCFASVGSVLIMGLIIAFRAAQHAGEAHIVNVLLPNQDIGEVMVPASFVWWPEDFQQALYVFPMFGVSFMCHFNALPTHQELSRPTRPRIRKVVGQTMAATALLYLFVAYAGHTYAGRYTCGNILLNFSRTDPLAAVARGCLGAVLMLNFPLICQPCRNALFRLLSDLSCFRRVSARSTESSASGQMGLPLTENADPPPAESRSSSVVHVYRREDSESTGVRRHQSIPALDTFQPKDATLQQSSSTPSRVQRYCLTTLILGGALLLSCFMRSIMVVWSILGSTVCFTVAFILPASFWFRIVGPSMSAWHRAAALTLVAIVSMLVVCCTIETLLKLEQPPCPPARALDEVLASSGNPLESLFFAKEVLP
eukprot:CAMPEP_0170625372 /NCGR_PEP_ID=MMETSP0224-20130122/30722_1 /TAXON_ID=285029 /ORGANISM="Togula jolla, Strain CCCM 725" /LENGTH=613 /DNA_ID=CAMNT_0010951939 /DNA_START=29 /DNA_END=1870 /DNA_ORIENTATION=-